MNPTYVVAAVAVLFLLWCSRLVWARSNKGDGDWMLPLFGAVIVALLAALL